MKKTLTQVVAENLQRIRNKRGLTLGQFAKALDMPKSSLGVILNPGQREVTQSGRDPSPTIGTIERLAARLHVAPWKLFLPQAEPPDDPEPQPPAPSDEEQALLADLRDLPSEQRSEVLRTLHSQAEHYRGYWHERQAHTVQETPRPYRPQPERKLVQPPAPRRKRRA